MKVDPMVLAGFVDLLLGAR